MDIETAREHARDGTIVRIGGHKQPVAAAALANREQERVVDSARVCFDAWGLLTTYRCCLLRKSQIERERNARVAAVVETAAAARSGRPQGNGVGRTVSAMT